MSADYNLPDDVDPNDPNLSGENETAEPDYDAGDVE
jgi:hypothetical protein